MDELSTPEQILIELKRQNALLEEQLRPQREADARRERSLRPRLIAEGNSFITPRLISEEMCSFMGLPIKSQRSQTDVTKFISGYVNSHSCFDPTFKRRIFPDTKLAKLLRVTDKDEVTYLNLQTYLRPHFIKS